MSASKDKRQRQEGRTSGMTENRASKEAAKQARTTTIKYRIFAIILAVVAVAALSLMLVSLATMISERMIPAVHINNQKYSVADFNYSYFLEYNSYCQQMQNAMGEYASVMLPDTSKSLKDQFQDEENGITWAKFFENRALERMKNITMLCAEAEAEGFTLSEEGIAAVDSEMSNLGLYASYYNFQDTASYLQAFYGDSMTERIYRANLERVRLAQEYSEHKKASYVYEDKALMDYYNEREDDYDYLNYRSFFISADAENGVGSMEKAKLAAENFRSKVTDEKSFIDQAVENASEANREYYADPSITLQSVKGKDITADYREWLLDSARKYGDVEIFAYESGASADDGEESSYSSAEGYHVLFFIERDKNDYDSVNGSFIFVSPKDVERTENQTDEEYEADQKEAEQAASDSANEILAAWNEHEYEDFAGLSMKFGSTISQSGEYTQAGKNDMLNEVSEWFFDSSRKAGDTSIIHVDYYGYFIVKFDGRDEAYNRVIADKEMRENEYASWVEEKEAEYTVTTTWTLRFAEKIRALGG